MSTRTYLALAAAGLLTLGLSGPASAFHDGGVAHCDGCHTMHNSVDNAPVTASPNNMLLKGSDPSSTCLNCHAGAGGYHVMSTDGTNVGQGGDFFFITAGFSQVVHGSVHNYLGDQAGHNIVATDFTLGVDGTNAQAPGGSFPAAKLGCNSCHNPHGNGNTADGGAPISGTGSTGDPDPGDGSVLGDYRLLGGNGYQPRFLGTDAGTAFSADPPIAAAQNDFASNYGITVDYGSGMSEWCGNCHPDFAAGDSHMHPAGLASGKLDGQLANYNSYVATGDFTGAQATSFDSLVPFEREVIDRTQLTPDPVAGPDPANTNAHVMCLTCHRAHASGNNNAGRWDFETELLAEGHTLLAVGNELPATAIIYYKRGTGVGLNNMVDNDIVSEYGQYQRSLCNKCHVWD
jgi:hypothetical protein